MGASPGTGPTPGRPGGRHLELPLRFHGQPDLTPRLPHSPPAPDPSVPLIEAVGASPGTGEGRAILITGAPDPAEILPDDILVCHITDPSWAAVFCAVSACVTRHRWPDGHGAIVARELGLPCVIGTVNGTERIVTGDRIQVDGTAGTAIRLG